MTPARDRVGRVPRVLVGAVSGLVAGAAALTGCGGDLTVHRGDVEGQISSGVAAKTGTTPEVRCPGDLKGRVGETMRCRATIGSDEYGVTVEVDKVDGHKVNFSFKIDNQPGGASS